jgi:hypothetical protein
LHHLAQPVQAQLRYQQMNMIVHQHKSMNATIVGLTGTLKVIEINPEV